MPSPEFFRVQPVESALKTLFEHWRPAHKTEQIPVYQALDRIVAHDIPSPEQIPAFRKSTVDGFAVRAKDTFGASQSLPAYLQRIGQIAMGQIPDVTLKQGQTAQIHTGGMVPDSADAVVMIEQTQAIDAGEIEVLKAVAVGENVIQVGEDVRAGEVILQAGHRVRSQDIGGLLAVGITQIDVLRRPRVGILSCGDELVAPEDSVKIGQIRDINAYTLSALIEKSGGEPILLGIARDTLEDYLAHARNGFEQCDMLILTAGSSVSTRDLTRDVIQQLGQPGILQHGLATKPGKPTILAVCNNQPVIGLPGNPVSALLVARQIVPELIARYLGQPPAPQMTLSAELTLNIPSVTGREDWIPVRLIHAQGKITAEPIFGKSNLIFTLIRADGLVRVPINSNGITAGTMVDVILF